MTCCKDRKKYSSSRNIKYLNNPSTLGKYSFLSDHYCIKSNKNINMKSLNFRLRKFFPIYAMFFSKREMHSDFSLMKIDICKRSCCRRSGIQSKTKLSHHNFSFILHNPVIEFCKTSREVRRRKDSSFLYYQFKRFADFYRKILSRVRINKTFSIHIFEINRFSKDFTNRKCSSFIFYIIIIASISSDFFQFSKCEDITIHRVYLCLLCIFYKLRKMIL